MSAQVKIACREMEISANSEDFLVYVKNMDAGNLALENSRLVVFFNNLKEKDLLAQKIEKNRRSR